MIKKLSISKLILLSLERSIDGYIKVEDFSKNYWDLYGYPRILKKASLARTLQRIREKGLIDFVDDQKIAIRLTKIGQDKAQWIMLQNYNDKWDGKWRLVAFDIPEKRRTARDLLRIKLKELGFEHWQKSIWATKKNITKPMRDFIKKIGIQQWVMVIESDNVGR